MGTVPTTSAPPAPPRISLAMVVCLAIVFVAATLVHSTAATVAALAAAALAWRWGPLIGGIVAGVSSGAIVMLDPSLPHPLPSRVIAPVVTLMISALAAGMVARRESSRAGGPAANWSPRAAANRSRETPIRGTRRVTGDYQPVRGGAPEAPRVRRSGDVPRTRPAAHATRRTEQRAADVANQQLEHDVIQRFLRDVRDVLGADEVALWEHLEEGDEVRPYAAAVQEPDALVIETKPPVDTLVHSATRGAAAASYDNESSYFLAVPAGAEGRFHGALGVFAADRQSFARDRAKTMMRGFAANLAELLNLLYDGRETRRHKGKTEQLAEASERIQKSQKMAALATEICQSALAVTNASHAAFVQWDQAAGKGTVECIVPAGTFAPRVSPDSLVGMACKAEKGVMLRENFRAQGTPLYTAGEPGARPGSVCVAALLEGATVLGAIVVDGDDEGQMTTVEAGNLKLLAKFSFAAVRNMHELQKAQGQAKTDALTGLPNRAAFDEAIEKLSGEIDRFGHAASLILCDVDKFKSVNDTYGHEAGDEVLKGVAKTMSHVVRNIDLCARYGGEEMAVLLPRTKSRAAQDVAERLRKAISETKIVADGKTIHVTASFGVACHPETVFGLENLFKAADEALYAAKNDGRNCVKLAMPKSKVS